MIIGRPAADLHDDCELRREMVASANGLRRGADGIAETHVEKPVVNGRNSICGRTRLDRVDLGGVEPRQFEPGEAKEREESKDTDDRSVDDRRVFASGQATHDQQHRRRLADRSDEKQLSAARLVDQWEGNARREGVDRRQDRAEDERQLATEAEVLFENRSRKVWSERSVSRWACETVLSWNTNVQMTAGVPNVRTRSVEGAHQVSEMRI